MISIFSNQHINQVFEIEKINFSNPWNIEQFNVYSMQPMRFLSYVYSKSSKIIGYLMSEIIINEVHIHNIAVEKNIKIIK